MSEHVFWAPQAWVDGRWERDVCLGVDARGHWAAITPGITPPPAHATVLQGPVLPGLVNAHSHAFQRAFAGLAERRESEADDFWSWRDRMYGVALRITPAQMRAVAAQLYVELLQGGYTQVCEFHYLHHQEDGQPYADEATMAWALADAAQDAGMGLTLLPVLYERAGFQQSNLRPDQRRFAGTPDFIARLQATVQASSRPLLNAGVAIHSLRAASAASIDALLAHVRGADMPIHIHVAEQMQEVRDCLAATGQRPIAHLAQRFSMDSRWQLVHATHTEATEIDAVARSGAGIVICPSTEGNLGDGFADLPGWLAAGVPMALGSDSHVGRQWNEEIRWLEYGQRLRLQQRNVAALPGYQPSTAARLLDQAIRSGAAAAGFKQWGLQTGARADMVVLDMNTPGLLGIPHTHTLDALVFACNHAAIDEVYVAGKRQVSGGMHHEKSVIAGIFKQTLFNLLKNTKAIK
ncbi:formimidoylglutamate deiminase [Rhodoferax mekongensis]|uniref:formimidoylglutamate deiminase n=1 Tax=Rhodoferax mekongensis TaxID=3068341 RepID=UPI0028BEB44B|nr:formimidoylglutamate deiminase [Rhodoferax sp. TBRC 17199]MDT7515041.1 formimidoylglutamate deiminase [Rhodoferax sp. TBRC 17199]